MTIDRRSFLQAGAAACGALAAPSFSVRHLSAPGRSALAGVERMAWWREARFGMFIHWGLYSILAGEWGGRTDYGEWIRNNARIPIGEYDRLVSRFNPVRFDADAWASLAKDAGMRYLTITTKHHDGFALFDSQYSDFCVRSTPFRRDIMRELSDACRRQGIVPCWYHSIMDWHHFDYLPRREWEAADRPEAGAKFARYVEYLDGQVEELLTRYGDIGVMWFDGQWESTWTREQGVALYQRCRALQPNVIVNNRVDGTVTNPGTIAPGDFRTPEQEVPATGWPGVDWESCITMNGNWGYNAKDHAYKSVEALIGLLVETASKGGNLLLNVGPKPDGTFPEESVERLKGIGRWMSVNADAIHGTTASRFAKAPFRSTSRPKSCFLFLHEWPAGPLPVPGLRTPVARAYLLADPRRAPLAVTRNAGGMSVALPATPPDAIYPVVALEFDRTPEITE